MGHRHNKGPIHNWLPMAEIFENELCSLTTRKKKTNKLQILLMPTCNLFKLSFAQKLNFKQSQSKYFDCTIKPKKHHVHDM